MTPNRTPAALLGALLLWAAPAHAAETAPAIGPVPSPAPAMGPGPGSAPLAPVAAEPAPEAGPVAVPQATPPGIGVLAAPPPAAEAGASAELAPDPDLPDEPAIASEIEKESSELEALRKEEGAAHVQEAHPFARRPVGIVEGLGYESPLRDRVWGALERDAAPRAAEGGRIALLPELDHDLATLQAEYDIPIDVNESVVAYIRFFQAPLPRSHFVKWLGRLHRYEDRFREILRGEGMPEDTIYLAMIESGFGNFAYSRAKASGQWQFIAPTGKLYGLQQDFWVDERRDPEKAARAAARYLKRLKEQTGDWRLAWAGYNAGVGRIFNAQRRGYDDFWAMAAAPGKGKKAILRAETKGYVPKLMAAAIITKHPDAFGFKAEEIERQRWSDYEEVTIPHATLLSVIARAAGVEERDIIELNPELRRVCTPPRPHKLKIPRAAAETFAANWPAMQDKVRMTFAGHVIRRGDTVASVAAHYGVPVQGLVEMNGLVKGRKLKVGSELLVPRPIGVAAVAARAPEPVRRPEPAAAASKPTHAPAVAVAEKVEASAKSERADKPARTTLRVRSGDTLWSISQRLGVGLEELCRWNNIKNPRSHKLAVGAMLVVYPERG